MNTIVRILMTRDKMSRPEAEELLEQCREMVNDGENPEDVLLDELGLEPDYIFDLLV